MVRTITWIAALFALVVGLSLPLIYLGLKLEFHSATLQSKANLYAHEVTQTINSNPLMWQFEEHRMRELVERDLALEHLQEVRLIIDAGNQVIAQSNSYRLHWPVLVRSSPLLDSGRVVGRFEVRRTLQPVILQTLGIAALSVVLALGVFHLLRGLSMRGLRQATEALSRMAHYDALTALPNRALFQRQIEQAIARARRGNHYMALLFLDLDRFKAVNDSMGHHYGDLVLQLTAARLKEAIRGGDTAARLSGDEFVAMIEELGRPDDAAPVAQKILEAVRQPLVVGEQQFHLSTSIGIAIYPSDGMTGDELLKHADTAMYHAKEQGPGTYQFFTQAMNARTRARLALEQSLRQALARGEFTLFYQAQVNLSDGRTAGCEALLRWNHPQRGLVTPNEFIPALEESGLICPVGEWVLRGACRQMRTWLDQGMPVGRVSVNVSPRQFRDPGFVRTVLRILDEVGLPARHLELELTESLLINDSEANLVKIAQLAAEHIRIAIDDFGTGYSSLAYLKRFSLQCLKIDQSFVQDIASDPNDEAIVAAIISLARTMGLSVVAEGVETEQQADLLLAQGCFVAQGYLFGKPCPPAQFEENLQKAHRRVTRLQQELSFSGWLLEETAADSGSPPARGNTPPGGAHSRSIASAIPENTWRSL